MLDQSVKTIIRSPGYPGAEEEPKLSTFLSVTRAPLDVLQYRDKFLIKSMIRAKSKVACPLCLYGV